MITNKIKNNWILVFVIIGIASISAISASLTTFSPESPPSHGNFPTPDYDSDWLDYSQGQTRILNHGLGTDNLLIQSTAIEQISEYNNTDAQGYWKMDEDIGTNVTDSSGNNRWGTTTNMTDANWIPGKCYNALNFTRLEEQYVNFGDIAIFTRWDDFSLEVWFKSGFGSTQHITGKMYSSGTLRGYEMLMANGQLRFLVISDYTAIPKSLIHVRTPLQYNDGAWHHFVATYDGSSTAAGVKLYVDSVHITHQVVADNLVGSSSSGANYTIGARGGGAHYFNGTIDEVVVYDYVLPQAKVTQRYNGGTGLCGGLEPPVLTNYTNMKYDGDVLNGYYADAITSNSVSIIRGVASDYASRIRTRIWKW